MDFDFNTLSEMLYPILRLKSAMDFKKWFKNARENRDRKDKNKKAAWDMYVEMATRITTQPLDPEHGDEKTALDSVYSLFQQTRDILHEQGPECVEFAQLALGILNEEVRPFTAKWHRKRLVGAFKDPEDCAAFREELAGLQVILRGYMQALAALAGIEDITDISEV